MKLTTTTQVSVDGVMQGNGGPEEGFERGGWARPPRPLFDDEAMTCVQEIYQRAEAFLFGRRTYGDVAAALAELKARPGGELQVHGSGALTRWLLENDLVDEMNLLIVPVVVGQGARLFPETGPDIALDLIDSQAFPRGITSQVYRPAGRPEYAAG